MKTKGKKQVTWKVKRLKVKAKETAGAREQVWKEGYWKYMQTFIGKKDDPFLSTWVRIGRVQVVAAADAGGVHGVNTEG